jgi:putative DNA methylase
MVERRGWHSRGYLPHFEGGTIPQLVTFRLADSLPKERLKEWERELATMPHNEAARERRERIDAYLDMGFGSARLEDPRVADVVENALLHFDGSRYRLHAWISHAQPRPLIVHPRGSVWSLADFA